MTTTPTQQPEALRLADALKYGTPFISGVSTIDQAEKEMRRLHAENEALREQLENSRKAHDTSGFVNAMQYANGIGKSMS